MSADDAFRRQLDRSLEDWVDEGLIESEQRDRLRSHYQLNDLPTAATSTFAAILLSIGGLLIGLGLITFVAANWDAIPRSIRAIGVLMLTLGLNTAGFFWWTTDGERLRLRPRLRNLGSALLLVGQLGWGASIALMAQWVQMSGSPAGLFAIWGSSVLLMAFCIRHVASGALGTVLVAIAYCIWIFDYGSVQWLDAVMPLAPLLAPFVLIGLAYWCRSRWVFALAAIASGITWYGAIWHWVNSVAHHDYYDVVPNGLTWMFVSWCALLWGGSMIHQRYLPQASSHASGSPDPGSIDFAPTAQALSVLSLLLGLEIASFKGFAEWSLDDLAGTGFFAGIFLSPVTGTIVVVSIAFAVLGWAIAWQHRQRFPTSEILMGSAIAVALASALCAVSGLITGWYAVVWANVLLFSTAAALAWQGLQVASRWRFWLGLLCLAAQILFRFFEYDTGLLMKSLVLVACGVSVIVAGLQFERSIHSRRSLSQQS